MPERGHRSPATGGTAYSNVGNILDEDFGGRTPRTLDEANVITSSLRKELAAKGLKGFKRGGKVKKTGLAKVHKGERILTAKQAKKVTPAKLRAAAKQPVTKARRRK